MECDRFYDFILYMSSYFLQWCFSRWTERNPYYEILRAHQQYAKDSYGGENDLGLRCKRPSKTFKNMFMPFWCDGSVRLLCGQNVNDSMWAIVGNEKLRMALATGVTFSSLKSCTVSKTAKPGGSSTSLWSQNPHSFGWENTLVSISGGSGIRPSCLIKPKSNGYKRDVVNTSIELQLFEVINSYYFLCNLFSSYGGL